MGILKKKYPAFTLLEMIIVLVLFTLVAGIASLAYTLLLKQYTLYRSATEKQYSLELLHHLLYTDIHTCQTAIYSETGFELIQHESSVAYSMLPDFILRKTQSSTDTFFVQAEIISCTLQGKGIAYKSIFDEINLRVKQEKSEICHFAFRIQYGADVLMARDVKSILHAY